MNASPWPVPEIATTSSRAYTPAPTIGESPTRPSDWPTIPPVEVAAATRPLTSLLYHVSPMDPLTYGCASVALVGAAALASYLPTRRTTAVNPVEALRAE